MDLSLTELIVSDPKPIADLSEGFDRIMEIIGSDRFGQQYLDKSMWIKRRNAHPENDADGLIPHRVDLFIIPTFEVSLTLKIPLEKEGVFAFCFSIRTRFLHTPIIPCHRH